MKQFQYTIIGLFIMSTALILVILFELDLFEQIAFLLLLIESYEADEIILFALLFVPFVVIDIARHSMKQKIEHAQTLEREKSKVYTAMARASQQILNNFLNQIQYFKLKAQNTPGFDPDLTKQCEQVIKTASKQIASLSQLNTINEHSINNSIGLPLTDHSVPDDPAILSHETSIID